MKSTIAASLTKALVDGQQGTRVPSPVTSGIFVKYHQLHGMRLSSTHQIVKLSGSVFGHPVVPILGHRIPFLTLARPQAILVRMNQVHLPLAQLVFNASNTSLT